MRPAPPSGDVVDLDSEELEDLAEPDPRAQQYAETEELDISGEVPIHLSQPRADPMRTGPGRSHPPTSEPLSPVATEPAAPSQLRARGSVGLRTATGPALPDATASLRKEGSPARRTRERERSTLGSQARLRESSTAESVPLADEPPGRPRSRVVARKPKSKPGEGGDENIDAVLGSYRIISPLGEGGMGKVYLAEHVKLGRKVALKLLRPEYAVKRDAVARFFKEAQAVNKIRHENIVDITDFVELDTGETFIIMELLEGDDLADLTRKADAPMPLHRAMQISLQVCDALEAAHRVGVIHRDLKPDNIFILNTPTRKDFVKLLDFGVAKLLSDSSETDAWQTAAGSVIGTPAYMSPEQASGIPVDARSDIYSLGAILYELFTGHPVFRAKSFGEYVIKHMNDDPIPPRDLVDAPKIPGALEMVILRCLEKDPNRRYMSVSELRDDLARATATVQTMIKAISPGSRPRPMATRTRVLLGAAIAGAVVTLAVVAFLVTSRLGVEDAARPTRDPYPPPNSTVPAQRKEPTASESQPTAATKIETVGVSVDSLPSGAEVIRKDTAQSIGYTPLDLQLRSGEKVEYVFRLAGYHEATKEIVATEKGNVSVELVKKRAAAVKPHSTKKGAKTKSNPAGGEQPQRQLPKPDGKKPRKVSPEDQLDPFGQ